MPRPWQWVIRAADEEVLASGEQWTELLASARQVAEERIAVYAYALIRAERTKELDGVVCQVRRAGETGRPVIASATEWVQRAAKSAAFAA